VAEALLDLFWDHDQGGVFTTGRDAESLVTRPKDLMDNATPSANSLAALALLRLSALTGEDTLRERAVDILRLLSDLAGKHPAAFGHLLAAVDLHTTGSTEIVVTGDRPDLVRAVTEQFLPNAVLAWGERHDSPLWEGRDGDQAYVCRQYACRRPVTDADALRAELARPTRIA
jgi:uncharacterized protein YyaL (SSP411 family)